MDIILKIRIRILKFANDYFINQFANVVYFYHEQNFVLKLSNNFTNNRIVKV
jgi:hypothetical protein